MRNILKATFLISFIIICSCIKEEQADVTREYYQGAIAGISEHYVALDDKTITVESFDISSGIVVLTSNLKIPTLMRNSVIVVDVDTMGYIRRVNEVIEESGKVTVQTESVDMTYLFVDKKFKLSTELIEPAVIPKNSDYKNTKAYLKAVGETFTDNKGFIHPVKVIFHSKDNKSPYKSINLLEPDKGPGETRRRIIDFYEDFSGVNIYKNLTSTVQLYISEGHVMLSSDAVFEFDFKGMDEIDESDENLKIEKKGDLYEFKYYLDSKAEAQAKLIFEASKEFSPERGEKELLKDVIKTTIKFFVAGVPVWITIDCDIESAYEFNAEASLKATWGFFSSHELDIGLLYTKETGNITPISDYEPYNEIYPLVVEGDANFSARFEVFPNIEVKFYGFFGPYCDIVPYIEGDFNGSIYYSPSGGDNLFAWNSGIDLGLDFRVGVKMDFIGLPLWNLKADPINCPELDLWDSPKNISLLTNVPSEVSSNTTIPLTFKVTDSWNKPALGVPIYFEGNGSFSKNAILTAFDGEASVNWMPGSSSGTKLLFAKIVDGGGKTIKQTNISTSVISGGTGTVTDIDGNIYNTVTIGTQVWMKENLKTTKFNDVTPIPLVTDNLTWGNLTTPGYCWLNNDVGFKDVYGGLYNWYSVATNKLCPSGWHVPSDNEWKTLELFLGMTQEQVDTTSFLRGTIEGGKLKETGISHWSSPNKGATNESGFTGRPGGFRCNSGDNIGKFYAGGWAGGNPSVQCFLWSSTQGVYETTAFIRGLGYNHAKIYRGGTPSKNGGLSVRCIKDN